MKFHVSVVDKILRLVELHGGRKDDTRLRAEVTKLDLTNYTQQSGSTVLVATEDIEEAKNEAVRVAQTKNRLPGG